MENQLAGLSEGELKLFLNDLGIPYPNPWSSKKALDLVYATLYIESAKIDVKSKLTVKYKGKIIPSKKTISSPPENCKLCGQV